MGELPHQSQHDGDELRAHVAVMADWLDVAADVISQDRGHVIVVAEAQGAADFGRMLAGVTAGPTAASAREAERARHG